MALDVAAIVGKALISAGVGRLVAAGSEGLRKRLDAAVSEGPLAKPLRRALEEACASFERSVHASFGSSPELDARLQVMMEDEPFLRALGELPYVPFHKIEAARCRELFFGLGLPGAQKRDFDFAWRALGRGYDRGAAGSTELASLIELAAIDRREEREERLVALVERLLAAQPAVPDEGEVLAAYRRSVVERYRWADTTGLFLREKEGAGEGIALQDVFVETLLHRAPEERKARRKAEGVEEAEEPGEWEEREERARRAAASASVARSLDEPPGAGAETRPAAEVLPRERLTVILGAPGSGKSTLMRCLAMALCRPELAGELLATGLPPGAVPLLFELKVYASALRQDSTLALDDVLLQRFRKPLPNVEELLRSGRAVVLLDGLDEVFDEDHRRWVRDEVWRVVGRFGRARFVLTSRPLGYRAAPLPGPVPLWWVAPFDDEQIGTFFRRWFEALAREGIEVDRERTPAERAADLTADVLGRDRIRALARNPLLCTLIVMVHRSRSGHLPQRRFVFYEAAVNTMVEFWERAKRSPKQEEYVFPEPALVTRALAEVAWRAFHELESREIPERDLRRWLAESFADDPEWGGRRGRRAVGGSLRAVVGGVPGPDGLLDPSDMVKWGTVSSLNTSLAPSLGGSCGHPILLLCLDVAMGGQSQRLKLSVERPTSPAAGHLVQPGPPVLASRLRTALA